MAVFKMKGERETGKRVILGLADSVRGYELVVKEVEGVKPRVAHGLTYYPSFWTGGGDTQLAYTAPEGGIGLTNDVQHAIGMTAVYVALIRSGVSHTHALLTAVNYAITYDEGMQTGLSPYMSVDEVFVWASYLSETQGEKLEHVTDTTSVFVAFFEALYPHTSAASSYTLEKVRHYLDGTVSRLMYEWEGLHIRVGADEGVIRGGRVGGVAHGAIVGFNGVPGESDVSARVFVFTRMVAQEMKYDFRPDWGYAYLVARFVERRFGTPVKRTSALSMRWFATYTPDDIFALNERMRLLMDGDADVSDMGEPVVGAPEREVTPLTDWRQYVSDHRHDVLERSYCSMMYRTYLSEGWSRLRDKYGSAVLDDMRLSLDPDWLFYSRMTGVVHGRVFTQDSSLHIPESVVLQGETITLTGVASHAFEGEPIDDLRLAPTVTHVGSFAFANTALTSLRLDDVDVFGKHVVSNPNAPVSVVIREARFVDAEPFPEGTEIFVKAQVVKRTLDAPVGGYAYGDENEIRPVQPSRVATTPTSDDSVTAELLEATTLLHDDVRRLLGEPSERTEEPSWDDWDGELDVKERASGELELSLQRSEDVLEHPSPDEATGYPAMFAIPSVTEPEPYAETPETASTADAESESDDDGYGYSDGPDDAYPDDPFGTPDAYDDAYDDEPVVETAPTSQADSASTDDPPFHFDIE